MDMRPYTPTKKKIHSLFRKQVQTNVTSIEKIPFGVINSTYAVTANKQYVLRVAAKERRSGFQREAFAFAQWKKEHVPVPNVYVVDTTKKLLPAHYSITKKKPGEHLDTFLHHHKAHERSLLTELGTIIKKMHRVKTQGYWFIEGGHGYREHWLRPLEENFHANIAYAKKHKLLTPREATIFDRFFINHKKAFTCHNPVLVHRDLRFENILTNGKKITAILDAEWCMSGDPLFELGLLCVEYNHKPDWLRWLFNGYFGTKKPDYKKIYSYAFFDAVDMLYKAHRFFGKKPAAIRKKYLPLMQQMMKKSHR